MPDSAFDFTFKKHFTAKYAYNLCTFTKLAGDMNTYNNKVCFHSFKDVGVYWIEQPISQALIDTSTAITVALKNFGITAVNSIDITYTIDAVPQVKETWTGALLPGNTVLYTFTTKLTKEQVSALNSDFSLCAYTTMLEDANAANNRTCKSIATINAINEITVDGITLFQNVPNPVTDVCMFNFTMTNPSNISIDIYNIYGLKVKSFGQQAYKGINSITTNLNGLSSGVYLYTLTAKGTTLTRSLLKL